MYIYHALINTLSTDAEKREKGTSLFDRVSPVGIVHFSQRIQSVLYYEDLIQPLFTLLCKLL